MNVRTSDSSERYFTWETLSIRASMHSRSYMNIRIRWAHVNSSQGRTHTNPTSVSRFSANRPPPTSPSTFSLPLFPSSPFSLQFVHLSSSSSSTVHLYQSASVPATGKETDSLSDAWIRNQVFLRAGSALHLYLLPLWSIRVDSQAIGLTWSHLPC